MSGLVSSWRTENGLAGYAGSGGGELETGSWAWVSCWDWIRRRYSRANVSGEGNSSVL